MHFRANQEGMRRLQNTTGMEPTPFLPLSQTQRISVALKSRTENEKDLGAQIMLECLQKKNLEEEIIKRGLQNFYFCLCTIYNFYQAQISLCYSYKGF